MRSRNWIGVSESEFVRKWNICRQVFKFAHKSFQIRQGVLAMTTATKRKTSHSTMLANNSATALVARHLSKYGELTIWFCFEVIYEMFHRLNCGFEIDEIWNWLVWYCRFIYPDEVIEVNVSLISLHDKMNSTAIERY